MKNLKNEITKLATTRHLENGLREQLSDFLNRRTLDMQDLFSSEDVSIHVRESGEILIQSKSATQYRPLVRVLEKGISIITRQKEFNISGFAREMLLINEALEVVQSDKFKYEYEEILDERDNYNHLLLQYNFNKEYNELIDKIIDYVKKADESVVVLNGITFDSKHPSDYAGGIWTFAVDVINSMLRDVLWRI